MLVATVIPPWYKRRGIAEKITPAPIVAARAILENPSSTDFEKSSVGDCPSPSSIAPSMVSDPMQKRRNEVMNPSENWEFVDPVLVLRYSPIFVMAVSRCSSDPRIDPVTRLRTMARKWVVCIAMLTPSTMVNRPIA